LWAQIALALFIAGLGVWASNLVAKRFREKDPQYVVIDEVSGQHLTLLLGCGVPIWWKAAQPVLNTMPLGLTTLHAALNWKYLLLGFILFRVFDIWKPFPARQAESLPGGWGIMADDWIAGIYAAIGLWIARAAGF
jgi:phosphatidylglycerophosphatase A